jgi:esterase
MDDGMTVRDQTLTLNGLRFHYRDWGEPSAPPLVLLHGYTSHARSWDTIARRLADRYRVLALDQRGHGESDRARVYHEQLLVDDLAALIDTLQLPSVALVGFSFGGTTAGSYAARYPKRVERQVLAECFGAGEDPALIAHLRAIRALPEAFDTPEEAAAAYRPLAPYAPEAELRHWMREGLARRPDGRWGWRYDPVLRGPGPPGRLNAEPDVFAARLADATCPTLLVVGAESFLAGPAERMVAAMPHLGLARIPRAGHWAPLDNPDGFLEVVDRFLTVHA